MKTFGEKVKNLYNTIGVHYNDEFKNNLMIEDLEILTKRLSKGSKILDVACAGGRDTNYFSKLGFDATGFDFSETEINYAKINYPRGKFIVGDLLELEKFFKKNYFDGIYSCATLDHLTKLNISKAIIQFNKILKMNGKLLVKTKEGFGILKTADKYSNGIERKFTLIKSDKLKNLLIKYGFKIIDFKVEPSKTRANMKFAIAFCQKISDI